MSERKPKIKLVHLLSEPEADREVASIISLAPLAALGIQYIQHINPPYSGEIPVDTCYRPEDISDAPGFMKLAPGHYGCYLAHKNAVLKEFAEDVDLLIVCEGDCILEISHTEFYKLVVETGEAMDRNGIPYFSFGDRFNMEDKNRELISSVIRTMVGFDKGYVTDKIIYCHCIMFPKFARGSLISILETEKWDTADLFYNRVLTNEMGILYNRVTKQHDGISILDRTPKHYLSSLKEEKEKADLKDNSKASAYKLPMIEALDRIYSTVQKRVSVIKPILDIRNFYYNFCNQAYVSFDAIGLGTYKVNFIDRDTGLILCDLKAEINNRDWNNFYFYTYYKYFINWGIEVEKDGEIVWSYNLDLKDKPVFIELSSKALGDSLAWMPYVEEFRKKHKCKIVVCTWWNNLFKEQYPELNFIEPGSSYGHVLAAYEVGIFDDPYKNKRSWRSISLQEVASDFLGLEYEELKPKITLPYLDNVTNKKNKYIAISENAQSGTVAKQWNFPNGWKILVDHLVSMGYEVHSIGLEETKLDNVVKKNGQPIEETIKELMGAELFIGVGSGLSWLAWSLSVPVAMISGFSEPWTEFTDCIRILNPDSCTGCYNDYSLPFERGNKLWCPRNKKFECSRTITPEMVISEVDNFLLQKQNI